MKNKFSFIGKGRTIILEFKTKGVIGMLIIEQIYESSDIKSDFVRCPSCKKGRLCDKPAGERATVIALKPDHVGRTSTVTEVIKTDIYDKRYEDIEVKDGRQKLILSTCYGSAKSGRILVIAEET